jgi:hypothetical protein
VVVGRRVMREDTVQAIGELLGTVLRYQLILWGAWAIIVALFGGCGALPAAEANAIPDRCACQCGPVAVSVGWADGGGKICAGAGAWRSCWALTGGE